MIDPDRLFRDQDPLDQNARSGAEGSGVGALDLELSTRKLNWSTATRASKRDGRDGFRARPRTQPATVGHQQLIEQGHRPGIRSPRTVEVYRANVMTKMQAGNLSELVRFAIRARIVED
ncbi:hypothetical protein V1294_004324 [Bradyrhizobium sp. AZCC 1678]